MRKARRGWEAKREIKAYCDVLKCRFMLGMKESILYQKPAPFLPVGNNISRVIMGCEC